MKLDINLIAQLEQENKELDELISKLYKQKWQEHPEWRDLGLCREEHEWYMKNISPLHDKIEANNEMMIVIKATNVDVGDGISLSPYSDWDAYTVIARRDTPKGFVLTIQEDKAIRTDNRGMSDSQDYRFEPDPNGIVREVRWSSKANWFSKPMGVYKVALGRHAYYDYSF